MRGIFLAALLASGCVQRLDITRGPCPCSPGYTCCEGRCIAGNSCASAGGDTAVGGDTDTSSGGDANQGADTWLEAGDAGGDLASPPGDTAVEPPAGDTYVPEGEMLGVRLPVPAYSTATQGPMDTYVTPYVASISGTITRWKAELSGSPAGSPSRVPLSLQLKVLRHVSENVLEVIAQGALHDPRPVLQERFGAAYPDFGPENGVIDLTEAGLAVAPGDIIGLGIGADTEGVYYYPLVNGADMRMVRRDAAVGDTIDLADAFTGTLPEPLAIEVAVDR